MDLSGIIFDLYEVPMNNLHVRLGLSQRIVHNSWGVGWLAFIVCTRSIIGPVFDGGFRELIGRSGYRGVKGGTRYEPSGERGVHVWWERIRGRYT